MRYDGLSEPENLPMPRILFVLAAALVALVCGNAGASAQTYPQRTVKFILPFGPASGTDIAARLVADRLAKRWGQPVVIENRPGGDGLVSINAFVSANDDHTLLWVPVGTFAVHPYQHDKLPYDAGRDLVPIANVTTLILALSAPASLKAHSLREFVELARAEPGKLNAAAANGNSDFLLSGFLKSNDLQVAKVPYRDIMQGPNDLAEGRIQLLSSSLAIVQPLMHAGKIQVLAVTSRKRAPSAPDVPTVIEAGFPAMEMESIGGIFGPRGMPLALRRKIASDVREAVASDPSIATKLQATGQVIDVRGPEEFAAGIKELNDKLASIAKMVGITPPK
jgi:tripartite-type tricarboxylate transporter receptor subunit TctC